MRCPAPSLLDPRRDRLRVGSGRAAQTRSLPGERFIERASAEGVRAVTNERDAPFGDYSMGAGDRRPDPNHVIKP